MIKVMISLPVHGKPDAEVQETQEKLLTLWREKLSLNEYEVELIDNITHADAPEKCGRLWHLGKSIQLMDSVDLVLFSDDYSTARGCVLEHIACHLYDVPHLMLSERADRMKPLLDQLQIFKLQNGVK